MPARPSYLPSDVWGRAQAASFQQKADKDIWSLGFAHQADQDIDGLAALAMPTTPPLNLQDNPETEPLPVVVSDRPDALEIQRQQRQQASMAMPSMPATTSAPAPASGTPAAMPSAGSAQTGMAADGSQSDSGSVTQGPRTRMNSAFDVTPDEPVTSETVTRAAAAALTKAGLPADMAPYIAGIAINEGILQPGTIARDNWSVGGVKAPGSAGVVTVPTREVINGQSVMQTASFGTFNSMQEGMDALAEFVRDSPRFGPVAQQAAQTGDYSNLIAGFKERGYATDPNWVQQVNSIAAGLRAPRVQQAAPPADTMARIPLTAAPASSPAQAAAAPSPAATGVPPAPVAASPYPAAPWEGLQADAQSAPLMMKAGDELMGPGDGGFAPELPQNSGQLPQNDPQLPQNSGYEDPDQGPREALPGSVGAQPLPQPAYADPTIGDASYTAPREPDPVQGPQQPAPASPVEQATNWVKDKLKPIYDAAGDVVGYVQAGADAVVQQAQNNMAQNRENVRAANAATGYGQVTSTPGEPDYVPPTTGPLTNAINTMVDPARNTYAETISGVNEQQDALEARMNKADPNEFAQAARVPLDVINRGLKIANAVLLATPQAGADAINGALEAAGIGRATVGVTLPLVGRIGIADLIDLGPASNIGMARTGMVTRPAAIRGLNWGQNIEDAAGAVGRAGAGAARAGVEAVREGADALGRGLQGVGREVAGGLLDLSPAARVIQESGGGMREIKPTVEVLQEQLDWTRSVIERARAEGNADLEKRAIDRAWQLESELVDARNARKGLEPAITSDQGRRIESLPLDERSADDFAGLGRERVSAADAQDLGGPASVVPERFGRANSAIPGFDPASAAMGGLVGSQAEGEDGETGDPLRTLGGAAFAGMAGRMGRKPGHTVATGLKPGQRYEFRVRVVPLRDLITSHLDNLSVNRAFPGALQPRVRERAASRVQIDKMVQAFDPEQVLMDTHRVDSGPMIVGPDMVVESGNGRGIALRRLASENPEAYANYVQALREELPYYGLTEDALQGIDQPVLVRERITPLDDAERARFATEANAPTAAQMSSMEQAMADARTIGDGPLGRIVVGEDQTIDEALLAPENGSFVRAFMATVPDTERGKMLEANGNLSVTGLARVKAALLARTYPGAAGERVATAIVESTDAGLRNVQNAVMGSLPSMARVEGLVASGDVDAGLSLAGDVAAAVDVYARLKRAGILVGDYLQQSGMFGGRETTPLQDAILGYLNDNARAPRRLRALLEGYAREVEGVAGAADDMFGGPATTATKEELVDGVLRRLGADPADQGADLGRVGAGSNVVEGSGQRQLAVPPADTGAQAGRGAGIPSLIDDVNAAESLTPEQQIARLQAENDRLRAERRGGGRRQQAQQPAPLQNADLPPVADDLIPSTGGEAGNLQVQGAPAAQPARPGPVGQIAPTGGAPGTLQVQGAPQPMPRPGPIPQGILPTGGTPGTLANPGAPAAPTPLARPTPVSDGMAPATGGPEGRLVAQEDARVAEALMANSRGARRYDDQQRRQISEATARYAEDVRELSRQISDERAAGNTPDRLLAQRAAAASRLHATMQLAEGNRGAAIRAFKEYDRQTALLQRDPKRAVEHFYKKLGGRENAVAAADEYTKMVEDGANPVQLAKFWAKAESGEITGADLFGLYRRFNMLSGPRTIEVNALSGAVNLGYEVLSQAGGQLARGRGTDAASEFAAPFKAMGRAFGNLAETMRHGVTTEQAARGDIPRTLSSRTDNRVAKGVLTAMEVPDRFNAAVDQFFRTMTEDWAATMLANKQARAAGVSPRSAEWAATVAKNLEAIREDVDLFPEIKRMADHVTFSEEPGGIGRGLEEFRRRAPLVANVLFPFIRTPYNIASRAVDISPLGIVRTGAEAATGLGRGRENISRRVRDNAIGLAAAYWAYDQATQGNVTGAGPDDPEKQAELRATGWQPYSVKVGDQYWSYSNFAPFSLALSIGAAAHEAKQYAKPGESDALSLLGDGAKRTAKVVTDMTVLAGVGAIIKSIQDPERYGGAWLTQFLSTLVPAGSLLNTVAQATDTVGVRRAERDTFANQVRGGLASRIPDALAPVSPIGARKDVPLAQDPLGRTVPNEQQGLGALNPFRPTTRRNDPAIQAFIGSGVDISNPKDTLTVVSGAAPIELTPAEQRRWNELRGAVLIQNVPTVAGSQRYQEAEKLARAKGLQTMLAAAAQAADKQLIAEIGGDEIKRRLTGAIEKRRAS